MADHFNSVASSLGSYALGSYAAYADPGQVLLFLDWDDTLFPTSELHFGRDLGLRTQAQHRGEMILYCKALESLLGTACSLSTRCVIVTLAKPGWIEDSCLDSLEPSLRNIVTQHLTSGSLRIVYAERGSLNCYKSRLLACTDYFNSLRGRRVDAVESARVANYVGGKHAAMSQEAQVFYSQYPRQAWKNIISIGDSFYEHEAVEKLCSERRSRGGRDRHIRSKTVRLQSQPSLRSLTLQLRLIDKLLVALVLFNGNISLDLQVADPLQALAEALELPCIIELHPLRYVWDVDLPALNYWEHFCEEPFAQCLNDLQRMLSTSGHLCMALPAVR